MDKSWIDLRDRRSKEYTSGVERFLSFAFAGKDNSNDEIYCPCSTCVNRYCHKLSIVRMHIERKGFDRNYKIWTYHEQPNFGENLSDEIVVNVVLYRWMYPIERYLQTLKHYVRNRARPEASIAKSIILEECTTFCSRYLNGNVETRLNRPIRNDDWGSTSGHGVGKGVTFTLDDVTKEQAHRYILTKLRKYHLSRKYRYILTNNKENTSTLARGIEWSILARLQNGLFVRDFEQSSNCPQYSNGDGSTSNI